MHNPTAITAFYKFFPLEEADVIALKKELQTFGDVHDMRGLVLLSCEGINGTVCGAPKVIEHWKKLLKTTFGELEIKDAEADDHVFPRFFVKVREEIVTLKDEKLKPSGEHHHLSPKEWNKAMEEDVVVLDTRNTYETEIGMFKGAVDPGIRVFTEFKKFVANAGIPKNKKVLMYCTGGIRCEKALLEMQKQGYKNVYQLRGGILAYMKQFPNEKFEGECFVFDHRVAVDQDLKPSQKYKLCPHCGDPGDLDITCDKCGKDGYICARCSNKEHCRSCSKNCRHHLERRAQRV